jgi:hypothetical protein
MTKPKRFLASMVLVCVLAISGFASDGQSPSGDRVSPPSTESTETTNTTSNQTILAVLLTIINSLQFPG